MDTHICALLFVLWMAGTMEIWIGSETGCDFNRQFNQTVSNFLQLNPVRNVWYNRKCNHKKKKPRIEIIWLLTILLCCLRQLHISIELFYDQASMLLKYYLFSLSHSDKKWQALRTVIHMENKIWSCGENSVGVRNSSSSIFLLKLPHHSCVGF